MACDIIFWKSVFYDCVTARPATAEKAEKHVAGGIDEFVILW